MGELSKVDESLLAELKIISGGDLVASPRGFSNLGEECTKTDGSPS